MQAKLKAGEIDVCIGMFCAIYHNHCILTRNLPNSSHGQLDRWYRQRSDKLQAYRPIYIDPSEMVSPYTSQGDGIST
jgi:hypothetical protein